MTIRRLLPVFLVLLQSGLTAAHAHSHTGPAHCSGVPHLHACELIELVTPAHDHEEHDGDDHDADAVDLSDLMTSPSPQSLEPVAFDVAPADAGPVFEAPAGARAFPRGLPPSTAGPPKPLYLAHCSLTI